MQRSTLAPNRTRALSQWTAETPYARAKRGACLQALFNFASCSAVCYSKELVGDAAGLMPLPVMAAHFIILFTLIGGTQPISGGHFNPMVSAVMAYWGAIPRARLPLYIGAQVSGATIGSALQWSLLAPELRDAVHAGVQVRRPRTRRPCSCCLTAVSTRVAQALTCTYESV